MCVCVHTQCICAVDSSQTRWCGACNTSQCKPSIQWGYLYIRSLALFYLELLNIGFDRQACFVFLLGC